MGVLNDRTRQALGGEEVKAAQNFLHALLCMHIFHNALQKYTK